MDPEFPGGYRGSGYLQHFSPNDTTYPDPDELFGSRGSSQNGSPYSHFTPPHESPVYGDYDDGETQDESQASDNEDDLLDDIDDLVAQIRPGLRVPVDDTDADPDFRSSRSSGPSEDDLSEDDQEDFEDIVKGPGRRGGTMIRGPGRPRSRGRGRPRGRGRGWPRGERRGPRPALEPTHEFKIKLSEASNAFIDGDYDGAILLVQRAIQENPEQFSAHSLLSEIFLAQGKQDKAVTALFNAAHTRPKDPKIWLKVAKMMLEMAGDDRIKALTDVIYCYSRIIDLDRRNFNMRFQRAALYRELRRRGNAMKEYELILKDLPHDTRVLRLITELCIEKNQTGKAKALWEQSIDHFRSQPSPDESNFGWSEVNVYVELYGYSGDYAEAIFQLKSLSRWLLGRGLDTQWELVKDDDREFDLEDSPRRTATPGFVADQYAKESYGQGLPLELRVKLGIYRLKLGKEHSSEAMSHFEWLKPEDLSPNSLVFDYADLFNEVGASLADAALSKEALRFYEAIEGMDEYSTDATVHLAMAKCYRALQLDKKAEECYRLAIRNDDKTVEARVQLAKLLEELKRPEEAYKYVSEAVLLERRKIQAKIGKAAPGARGNLMHLDSTKKRVQFNRATRVQTPNLEALAQKHPRVAALATEDSSPARGSPPAEGFGASRPQRERDRKRRLSEVDPTTRGTHPRKAPKSMDAEAERDGTAQTLYNTLLVYQDGMRKGDYSATEAWLDAADTLLRDFRSNRVFYPWERHQRFLGYTQDALRMSNRRKHLKQSDTEEMTVIAQRLHSTLTTAESGAPPSVIPTTYRGLSFATWLDIFLEYAFVSAKIGDAAESYDALTSATDANVFYHSKSGMSIIHAVYFTCALLLHDEETLLNIARVFISGGSTTHNLSPSTPRPTHNAPSTANALPFRHQSSIYAILARAHSHKNPVTWYNAGPNQKYILRQIKQMDTHLQTLRPSDPSSAAPGAPNSTIMSSFDLPITLMYGHMLSTAASHTNALAYYLRAYSINPSHPLILLSIALAYIHWSLKRQAGNRHYLILQGSYFLNKYHALRSQSALLHERQEAEYNVGRVWHMLSCTELAIPHYEKVLSLGKEMDEEAAKRRAVREATKAIRAGLSVQDIIEKAGAAYSDTVDDGGPQAKAHISLQLTPEEMAIAEEKIAQYRQTHSKGKSSHAHQNTQNGSLTPAISSEANRENSNGIEFPKDEDEEDENEAFTESFTSHAALCLALIYAGSSSAERAREITEEWLTLC